MGNNRQIILFYGAGAEAAYSMPTGVKYRENTILNSSENEANSILSLRLNALKNFYSTFDNPVNHTGSLKGWITKYEKHKYSATFDIELLKAFCIYYTEVQPENIETVIVAAIKIFQDSIGNDNEIWNVLSDHFEKIDVFFKRDKNKYIVDETHINNVIRSTSIEDGFDEGRFNKIVYTFTGIFKDEKITYQSYKQAMDKKGRPKNSMSEKLESIANMINGFGDIERYFHTYINPAKYGKIKFWKLVNFYWFCWFEMMDSIILKQLKSRDSIFIPYDQYEIEKYINVKKERMNYDQVLESIESLRDFTVKMYQVHKRQFGCFRNDNFLFSQENFNKLVRKGYEVSLVTTNYTPYSGWVKNEDLSDVVYLHGELDVFQNPNTLEVKKIDGYEFGNGMLVPYLLAQTAVKPIVAQYQISEFDKFISLLNRNEANDSVLIIIGYALNEDDNHINSMIREFVTKGNKLIYAHYVDEKEQLSLPDYSDIEKITRNQKEKLKLSEHEDLKVIYNYQGQKDLFDKIVEVI